MLPYVWDHHIYFLKDDLELKVDLMISFPFNCIFFYGITGIRIFLLPSLQQIIKIIAFVPLMCISHMRADQKEDIISDRLMLQN